MTFVVLLLLGLAFDFAASFFRKRNLLAYVLLAVASLFVLLGSVYFVFYFQGKYAEEDEGWVNWTFASFALAILFLQLVYGSIYIKRIGKWIGVAATALFFLFALTGVGMLCYYGRISLDNESVSSTLSNLVAILLA